ncbi:hypothetical protein J6590_053028 [Homalodisca vitripennis]|nr:hypothetical protein J6590_053028 [Homalodisca vitripennis]
MSWNIQQTGMKTASVVSFKLSSDLKFVVQLSVGLSEVVPSLYCKRFWPHLYLLHHDLVLVLSGVKVEQSDMIASISGYHGCVTLHWASIKTSGCSGRKATSTMWTSLVFRVVVEEDNEYDEDIVGLHCTTVVVEEDNVYDEDIVGLHFTTVVVEEDNEYDVDIVGLLFTPRLQHDRTTGYLAW